MTTSIDGTRSESCARRRGRATTLAAAGSSLSATLGMLAMLSGSVSVAQEAPRPARDVVVTDLLPPDLRVYTFDRQHTEVRVSWDHLGLSRQSAEFTDVTGKLVFDPTTPANSRVEATIKVAGVVTGVAELDRHLVRTKDYFDVAAHPTITFASREVTPTGEKTADVAGDLTINGITKPVVLAVVWNFSGPHPLGTVNPTLRDTVAAGFSARTLIQRSDWGITRIIPLVSDDIRIDIEAELIQQQP